MGDQVEAFGALDQFESSAAHPASIVVFELAVLWSLLTRDARVNDNNNLENRPPYQPFQWPLLTCPSCILVTILDIRVAKTTVAIVHGQRAGRRQR